MFKSLEHSRTSSSRPQLDAESAKPSVQPTAAAASVAVAAVPAVPAAPAAQPAVAAAAPNAANVSCLVAVQSQQVLQMMPLMMAPVAPPPSPAMVTAPVMIPMGALQTPQVRLPTPCPVPGAGAPQPLQIAASASPARDPLQAQCITAPEQVKLVTNAMLMLKNKTLLEHYDRILTETASIHILPLRNDTAIPFGGVWQGRVGLHELLRRYAPFGEWARSFDLVDVASAGSTAYARVELELFNPITMATFKSSDVVMISFAGGLISEVTAYLRAPDLECFFANVLSSGAASQDISPSMPPLNSADAQAVSAVLRSTAQHRLVPEQQPCTHNSWDNVRIKKGDITFRCRECQKQWRTQVASTVRCQEFVSGTCNLGSKCPNLHVHAHKQSLQQRIEQFGDSVLVRVPAHQWMSSAPSTDLPPVATTAMPTQDISHQRGASDKAMKEMKGVACGTV